MTPRLRLLLPLAAAASATVLLAGCIHVRGTAAPEVRQGSVRGYVARKSKPERAAHRPAPHPRTPARIAVTAKPDVVASSQLTPVAPARQLEPSVALTQAAGGPNPVRRPADVARPIPVERPALAPPVEAKPAPPAKSEPLERPQAGPQPAPQPAPQATPQPAPAPPAPAATAKPADPTTPARPTAEIRRQGAPSQPEAATLPPPAKAPPKTAPTVGIAGAIDRANLMLRVGNVQGAREALADSVKARNAEALSELARTYDPLELQAFLVAPGSADPAKAIELYTEAARLGSGSARVRLERLKASQTAPKPKN